MARSKTIAVAIFACACLAPNLPAQSADALINKLLEKGILTEKEAQELKNDVTQTNTPPASKWKISDAIKSIGLYGDVRFRYEYRAADNVPGSGESGSTYERERFRYAVRIGLRGDLFDDFYYGLRIETSSNPRSPWVTFGDDTNPTPSAKNSDGVNIGQAYLGWRPTDWLDLTVGRMPMPLFVTPMIWDTDINPEGLAEHLKYSLPKVDLFANFGQFIYQDANAGNQTVPNEPFILAWQVGANVKLPKDMTFKFAPVLYSYTGNGQNNGLNLPFTGQGQNGLNPNTSPAYNQNGINDLLVLETPAEFNFKLGSLPARVFGDFAYNFQGDNRAQAAFVANQSGVAPLARAYTQDRKAYQVGLGVGNLGLVSFQTSKRNTWEARVYWQHVEQYAADVNLLDSDFFEGRGNLQGIYTALAYSITDSIIAAVRYGYAKRINNNLGTGGNNPDLPVLNPINNYNLVQVDLGWRF